MSRGTAEPKLTAADAMIDKLTVAVFMFQIIIVLVLGFAGNIWKDAQRRKVIFLYNKHCRETKSSQQYVCMISC